VKTAISAFVLIIFLTLNLQAENSGSRQIVGQSTSDFLIRVSTENEFQPHSKTFVPPSPLPKTCWSIQPNPSQLSIGKSYGEVYQTPPFRTGGYFYLPIKRSLGFDSFKLEIVPIDPEELPLQLYLQSSPVFTNWKLIKWKLPKRWIGQDASFRMIHTGHYSPEQDFRFCDPIVSDVPIIQPTNWGWHLMLWGELLILGALLIWPAWVLQLRYFNHYSEGLPPAFGFPILICITALMGYGIFYAFVASTILGISLTIILYWWSFLHIGSQPFRTSISKSLGQNADFRVSLLLWGLATVISLSAGLLFFGGEQLTEIPKARYLSILLPHDNILPQIFAERLFAGQPMFPFFNEWLSSDRPPLQSAIILMVRGFFLDPDQSYELTSMLLQTSLIPIVYSVLRSWHFQQRASALVAVSIIFSPLFLLNSFYVWPKLLPVGFMLITTLLLFSSASQNSPKCERFRVTIIGITSAFALLCHGGSIFGLIPLFGVALFSKNFPKPRYWLWMILPFFSLMLPWSIYQKVIDPPGNRLLLWHLAGYYDTSNDGLLKILISQYQKLDIMTWAEFKLHDLRVIFGDWKMAFMHFFSLQMHDQFSLLRMGMFSSFLINLLPVFPFAVFVIITPRWRKPQKLQNLPSIQLLFILSGGLMTWILMMYGSGKTVLHQGTYYLPILAHLWALSNAVRKNEKFSFVLLISQILLVSWVWVLPSQPTNETLLWLFNSADVDKASLITYLIVTVSTVGILSTGTFRSSRKTDNPT